MIVLVAKWAHTHQPLERRDRLDFRVRTYHQMFRTRRLPRATYVFSDFDRLDCVELELAGRLYRQLSEGGARVLNDPARVRQRYGLLRHLRARGLNAFDVWRAEDAAGPDRFPVFLRTESHHVGRLSGLLYDEEQVRQAVREATARGTPLRELILVEYHAEPIEGDLFRKLAMYRVGDRLVPGISAHKRHWYANIGENGVAGEAWYEDERRLIEENRYERELVPFFQVANIDYGRADFGLVDGQVQVYEINTNPMINPPVAHPFDARVEAMKIAFRRLVEAFEGIDPPSGPPIEIDDVRIRRQRWFDLSLKTRSRQRWLRRLMGIRQRWFRRLMDMRWIRR